MKLPLIVSQDADGAFAVKDSDGFIISELWDKTTADQIARAVNCHEELVAALQFIADNAKQMAESDSADRGLWAACNEQAGAILAKVQS